MSNIVPFDYEGHPVQLSADGWLNATAISKKFGKRPSHWLALPTTSEYLEALAKRLCVGSSDTLIRRKMGRNGGVWLHPKLAVAFARWLSADFRCGATCKSTRFSMATWMFVSASTPHVSRLSGASSSRA